MASEKVVDPSLQPKVEAALEELREKMTEGIAEIRKRADIGAFDISEKAVSALRTLQEELDEAVTKAFGSAHEHFSLKLAAVKKCLDSMRSLAKNDLQGPITERGCFNSLWRALKENWTKSR